ncbi:MAG: hypothetical protein KF802_10135 [Bdellovibrionaceae bacterium]|nr:hypothetical protein [Pseudobdellovibrionaceae bacterium]
MNGLWLKAFFSGVKGVVVGALSLSLCCLAIHQAQAQTQSNPLINPNGNPCSSRQDPVYDENGKFKGCKTAIENDDGCKDRWRRLVEAEKEKNKACSEASMGSECVNRVQECIEPEVAKGTDWSSLTSMLGSAGSAFGMNLGSLASSITPSEKKCPNMSSRDYADEKSRIDREIKEAQSDHADLEKEIAEEKKDLQEKFTEAQKAIDEANKEIESTKIDVSEQKREQTAQFTKMQSETASQIRDANTKLLEKRNAINAYERNHTRSLNALNEELGKKKCLTNVMKYRAELEKDGVFGSGSGGLNSLASAEEKRKALQVQYDVCVADIRQQRLQLVEQRSNYLSGAMHDISNIEQSIADANQQLSTMNQNLQESLASQDTRITNAQKALNDMMTRSQNELNSLATISQQKQLALQQKQTTLMTRIATLQADLAKLGPAPKSGSRTGWSDAQRAVIDYMSAGKTFANWTEEDETTGSVRCCAKKPYSESSFCQKEAKNIEKNFNAVTTGKKKSGTK